MGEMPAGNTVYNSLLVIACFSPYKTYKPPTVYEYLDKKRKRKVIELQKQIANLDTRMSKIQPS
jgi:hypothetical protein